MVLVLVADIEEAVRPVENFLFSDIPGILLSLFDLVRLKYGDILQLASLREIGCPLLLHLLLLLQPLSLRSPLCR